MLEIDHSRFLIAMSFHRHEYFFKIGIHKSQKGKMNNQNHCETFHWTDKAKAKVAFRCRKVSNNLGFFFFNWWSTFGSSIYTINRYHLELQLFIFVTYYLYWKHGINLIIVFFFQAWKPNPWCCVTRNSSLSELYGGIRSEGQYR